jgi:peptidoglycan/xylan/chitin deacetylase (PgdA/CDA1 family)
MSGGWSAILTYHSLDDSGSVISTPPSQFQRQMEFLASSGIPVLPLDQALDCPGSVAITFDDGFRNILDEALPALERHRFPATIFVVSGYCGRRNNWPGQGAGTPSLPLMSWPELAGLPALISVGAHTATHPNLMLLPASECEREMSECQTRIEQSLGRPVRWLAYPYGASSPEVRSLAGQHFDLAVGTVLRFLPAQWNPLDLPRIDTYYFRGWLSLERLFTRPGGLYLGARRLLREARSSVRRWRGPAPEYGV